MRVAAILNFIADHPGQAFALTDLVRALKLSRATCHALLTGLVDVGYLYRTSDKTYVLGPALAAIGRTAAEHFSPLQVAQPEMRILADEFDVLCGAYFLEDGHVLLRERAASVSHVGYPVPLGTKFKLHVSLASAFYSWTEKDEETWLRTTDSEPTEEQRALFKRTAKFARENGYVVILRKPGFNFEDTSSGEPVTGEVRTFPVEALDVLEDSKSYPLAAIFAPVFDRKGRVSFALGMVGFFSATTGTRAREMGQRLREACDRITAFTAGRDDGKA
jgi:DNA-binding IclR family transcriptional regulator